jgi:hypothetical protein
MYSLFIGTAQCNRQGGPTRDDFDQFTIRNLLSSRIGQKKSEFSGAHSCIDGVFVVRNAIDKEVRQESARKINNKAPATSKFAVI